MTPIGDLSGRRGSRSFGARRDSTFGSRYSPDPGTSRAVRKRVLLAEIGVAPRSSCRSSPCTRSMSEPRSRRWTRRLGGIDGYLDDGLRLDDDLLNAREAMLSGSSARARKTLYQRRRSGI